MLRHFLKFFFKTIGWKIVGSFPKDIPKTISIVAPHATWIDFPVGLGVRAAIELSNKLTINFLGKAELFKGFFGWFFRGLGGIPVERFSKNDMVQSVVNLFNAHENLHIALAPEGTRQAVSKLRTGFYYMAKQANVPIVMIGFDFEKKQVIIKPPFFLSDNMEEDLRTIARFYDTIGGVKKEWIANYLMNNVARESVP
jgi:1-acyl-sn-glycerol-3-phosphate acyltransferase